MRGNLNSNAMKSGRRHTSPKDDLACNHFDNFLWEDFLMSKVIPEGLQGNTWFDLYQHKRTGFVRYLRKEIHKTMT